MTTDYPCAYRNEGFDTREARDEHTREADDHTIIDPTANYDRPVEW